MQQEQKMGEENAQDLRKTRVKLAKLHGLGDVGRYHSKRKERELAQQCYKWLGLPEGLADVNFQFHIHPSVRESRLWPGSTWKEST